MMNRILRVAALLSTLLPAAGRAAGQQRDAPHGRPRVPVVVAMLDSGRSESSAYRILRGYGDGREDVIVFASNADVSAFSGAVRQLLLIRRVSGDTAATAAEVRVRGSTGSASRGAPFPWADRVLTDLRNAERRQVPRVGSVRAVRIWLPAQGRGLHGTSRS